MGKEATESRDYTAAATPCHSIPVRVERIRDGRAIEDDEKFPSFRCLV